MEFRDSRIAARDEDAAAHLGILAPHPSGRCRAGAPLNDLRRHVGAGAPRIQVAM
jgi:hypothetical protein